MVRTIFITRSDISWYSKNANVQVRPRQLARDTKLTLCVNAKCSVPQDLAAACERVVVYRNMRELPTLLEGGYHSVVTGFGCQAIKRILSRPDYDELCAAARRETETKYSDEANCNRLMEIYREVVDCLKRGEVDG